MLMCIWLVRLLPLIIIVYQYWVIRKIKKQKKLLMKKKNLGEFLVRRLLDYSSIDSYLTNSKEFSQQEILVIEILLYMESMVFGKYGPPFYRHINKLVYLEDPKIELYIKELDQLDN